jgi:hypothetical protein
MAETNSTNLHAPIDRATKVGFPSGDGFVVGHLYLPDGYDAAVKYPAVVVAGSLTSVKEMMGGIYAGKMADRGLLALVIDYRNYG